VTSYRRRHHGDASSAARCRATNVRKLKRQVLDRPKFSRRHEFQAKKFGRQCTKFGSHAVGLQENSSEKLT